MSQPGDRMQRIALATFASVELLEETLGALVPGTVGADQVCIVGSRPRIDIIHQTSGGPVAPTRVLALMARSRLVAVRDDGLALIVGPADFTGLDLDAERQADGLLNVAEPAIVAGALALFVVSRTVPELVGVTRTLLRHSSNRVYTRELPE